MIPKKPEVTTIIVPDIIAVFTDKKTQVKSVAFPFAFPLNSINGIITLTRLDKGGWQPARDIESITIKFKEHEDTTLGE